MRVIALLCAAFWVSIFSSQARAEPGPCQEGDLKAKAACLNVWIDRLRARADQALPQGTMIAWRPSIEEIDKAGGTVRIPKGWEVCDLRGSVTPGSAYLKGVSAKDYAESFNPQDPLDHGASKGLHGGKPRHEHSVAIPGQTVDQRKDLRYGDGDQTHAANTIHGHSGSTSTELNDPPFAKVIWLCARGDQAVVGWSSFGYGGDQITIARKGSGFSEPIERSYAVCNSGSVAMTAAFRSLPSRGTVSPGVNDNDKIEPGECIGMDRPSWLRVASHTGRDVVKGNYYALLAGTFPKDGIKFRRDQPQAGIRMESRVGTRDVSEIKVRCDRLPESSPLRKQFYSACKIPLPRKSDYRLCFPQNFADQPENNYAWGALRLIVDRTLINRGIPQIGPDPRSAVAQDGCMDLWGTGDAIVLIAPPEPATPWDPKLIKSVRVSVRELLGATSD